MISQRDLERMGYSMLQPVFAGCLNLLEFFLAYKVTYCTIVNPSNKLSTMQADWYTHQFRLRVHSIYKTSMCSRCQVKNRGCRTMGSMHTSYYYTLLYYAMLCKEQFFYLALWLNLISPMDITTRWPWLIPSRNMSHHYESTRLLMGIYSIGSTIDLPTTMTIACP